MALNKVSDVDRFGQWDDDVSVSIIKYVNSCVTDVNRACNAWNAAESSATGVLTNAFEYVSCRAEINKLKV